MASRDGEIEAGNVDVKFGGEMMINEGEDEVEGSLGWSRDHVWLSNYPTHSVIANLKWTW